MKKTVLILLTLSILGCTKNMWISQNAVRPKKPKFSMLKEKFTDNSMINHKFFYAYKRILVSGENNKDVYSYSFAGLYPDGRMIGLSLHETDLPFLDTINSWETANNIGYYTTKDDKIKWQYFAPFDFGTYITEEAIIKHDTLIIYEKYRGPFKTKIRYDTLIKSSYFFK